MKKYIYLDYAATTPVYPQVVEQMLPYFTNKFGNPSSIHFLGQEARMAVDEARGKIAKLLNVNTNEIFFTGTTTVSNNLAIQGVLEGISNPHIVTSTVEHHAVLDVFKAMENKGVDVSYVCVDKFGIVDLSLLEKSITAKTVLVSIMYANNEVGTVEPIEEIGKIIKTKEKEFGTKIYFHVDATTAVGWLPLNLPSWGVDLFSLGAHKFGGPKGVGILYASKTVKISAVVFGGHHESGLYPGTEAVPLIVGMAKALQISLANSEENIKKTILLRDKLISGMLKISGISLTGHPSQRLADIASFLVDGVEGEAMLLLLSEKGVAASSGSACTSGQLKPSHVLLAMGIAPEKAHGSIRFSLGPETKETDIDYVLTVFPEIIGRLRAIRRGIK
jgi:cysteine desulfurase